MADDWYDIQWALKNAQVALTADAVQVNLNTHLVDVTTAHGINNYAKKAQEAWIAPTLLNGWVNSGGSYATAGYMKDSMGFVHIKGLVKDGVTTVTTSLFVLPVGYRPLETLYFSTLSNGLFGGGFIASDGRVGIIAGSNVSFSLFIPPFKAEL